jgi:hypothetical protein
VTAAKRRSSNRVRSWVKMNWDAHSSGSGDCDENYRGPRPDQPGTSTGLGYDLA